MTPDGGSAAVKQPTNHQSEPATGVRILTVLDSTARGDERAHDLDVVVMFESGADPGYLAMINELVDLTHTQIDFVHLNRGGQ